MFAGAEPVNWGGGCDALNLLLIFLILPVINHIHKVKKVLNVRKLMLCLFSHTQLKESLTCVPSETARQV